MVNQIRTISKQRLTDYYDNKNSKHIHMMLDENQMKKILDTISQIGKQSIIIKNNKTLT